MIGAGLQLIGNCMPPRGAARRAPSLRRTPFAVSAPRCPTLPQIAGPAESNKPLRLARCHGRIRLVRHALSGFYLRGYVVVAAEDHGATAGAVVFELVIGDGAVGDVA